MNDDLVSVLAEPGTSSPITIHRVSTSAGILNADRGREYPSGEESFSRVPEASYADNFGFQWNRFRREQLDTEQGSALSRKRFEGETGWTTQLQAKWVVRSLDQLASLSQQPLPVDLGDVGGIGSQIDRW